MEQKKWQKAELLVNSQVFGGLKGKHIWVLSSGLQFVDGLVDGNGKPKDPAFRFQTCLLTNIDRRFVVIHPEKIKLLPEYAEEVTPIPFDEWCSPDWPGVP